jgi:hypothetical protein
MGVLEIVIFRDLEEKRSIHPSTSDETSPLPLLVGNNNSAHDWKVLEGGREYV